MKQIVNKLNAGALALLMLVATAIAPASTALAYVPPIAGEGTGNNTRAYCKTTDKGATYLIHTDTSGGTPKEDNQIFTYIWDYYGDKDQLIADIAEQYGNISETDFCKLALQKQSNITAQLGECIVGGTTTPMNIAITNTADDTKINATYDVFVKNSNGAIVKEDTLTIADGAQESLSYSDLAAGTYTVQITASDGTPFPPVQLIVGNCETPKATEPSVTPIEICGMLPNDRISAINYDTNTTVLENANLEWEGNVKTFTFTIKDGLNLVFSNGETTITKTITDTPAPCEEPPLPEQPKAEECKVALYGRTIRPVDKGDATVRDKYGEGGEINADTWGNTYRLYGAVNQDTDNVTLTFTAAQGMSFDTASVAAAVAITIVNPETDSIGGLDEAGYIVAATGIGAPALSEDGKTITLTVDSMPAMSAVAFNVTFTADDSYQPYVIDSVLTGDLAVCPVPPAPAPNFDDMTCEVNDEVWYQIPAHDENTYYTFKSGNGEEVRVAAGKHALLRINQSVVIRAYTINAHGQEVQNGEWKHDFTIPVCTPGMGGEKPVTPILPAPAKPAVAVQELPQTGAADMPNLLWTGLGVAVAVYGATYFAQRKQEN